MCLLHPHTHTKKCWCLQQPANDLYSDTSLWPVITFTSSPLLKIKNFGPHLLSTSHFVFLYNERHIEPIVWLKTLSLFSCNTSPHPLSWLAFICPLSLLSRLYHFKMFRGLMYLFKLKAYLSSIKGNYIPCYKAQPSPEWPLSVGRCGGSASVWGSQNNYEAVSVCVG